MSEVKRKKGESFEAFFRRVKDTWRKSGKLLQARKVQYFEPSKSKNVQRKSAIIRATRASKIAYLQKIGKMAIEEPRFGNNNKNKR